MNKITRVELYIKTFGDFIDNESYYTAEYFNFGRVFEKIEYDLQDNGKTLKVGIDE